MIINSSGIPLIMDNLRFPETLLSMLLNLRISELEEISKDNLILDNLKNSPPFFSDRGSRWWCSVIYIPTSSCCFLLLLPTAALLSQAPDLLIKSRVLWDRSC